MQGNWRQKYLRYKSYLLNTVDRYQERTDVRIYLEILLSLITISIFSIFALRPTILTIAELIKEIESKEQLVDRLDSKIETITQAQILYDRERNNILLLKESIPQEPETDNLIYQLEGLVEKNNLKAQSLGIGETTILGASTNNPTNNPQDKDDVSYIPFNIQLTGKFTSLHSFIADVEKLSNPIKILKSTIMSKKDDKTREINLVLTLSGQVPYERIKDKNNNTE